MKVPVQQHDSANDHSTLEWIVSLLFWSQMLIAASLYGLVALSPKLLSYIDLQGEHFKRQSQLVSLENHISEIRQHHGHGPCVPVAKRNR